MKLAHEEGKPRASQGQAKGKPSVLKSYANCVIILRSIRGNGGSEFGGPSRGPQGKPPEAGGEKVFPKET